jgi:F0F1-type ATP synthase assembly protein I
MSESEGPVEEAVPTLPIALDRIAIGITFGATLVGILFTIWTLTVHGAGPIIGILVFQLIGIGALSFIMLRRLKLVENLPFCPERGN